MRIAKNTVLKLESGAPRFLLVADAFDGEIRMEKEGRTLLSLCPLPDSGVAVRYLAGDGQLLTLQAEGACGHEVILTQGYARIGLYVDGRLTDEDFFLQPFDFAGATIHAGTFMHFEAGYEYHSMEEAGITGGSVFLSNYRPRGNGSRVLTATPALFNDRLHIFYIESIRDGKAKGGLGGNRLRAVFTTDARAFSNAPIALPIDSVEEYSFVDAAALKEGERFYLYYLVDTAGGRMLSCAVSEDGFSFRKTGLSVEVPGADAAQMTSLSIERRDGAIYLIYTANGTAYAAKSRDLLYFDPPTVLFAGPAIVSTVAIPGVHGYVVEWEGEGCAVVCPGFAGAPSLPPQLALTRLVRFNGSVYVCGVSPEGGLYFYGYAPVDRYFREKLNGGL